MVNQDLGPGQKGTPDITSPDTAENVIPGPKIYDLTRDSSLIATSSTEFLGDPPQFQKPFEEFLAALSQVQRPELLGIDIAGSESYTGHRSLSLYAHAGIEESNVEGAVNDLFTGFLNKLRSNRNATTVVLSWRFYERKNLEDIGGLETPDEELEKEVKRQFPDYLPSEEVLLYRARIYNPPQYLDERSNEPDSGGTEDSNSSLGSPEQSDAIPGPLVLFGGSGLFFKTMDYDSGRAVGSSTKEFHLPIELVPLADNLEAAINTTSYVTQVGYVVASDELSRSRFIIYIGQDEKLDMKAGRAGEEDLLTPTYSKLAAKMMRHKRYLDLYFIPDNGLSPEEFSETIMNDSNDRYIDPTLISTQVIIPSPILTAE